MSKIAAISSAFAVAFAVSPMVAQAAPAQLNTATGKTLSIGHRFAVTTPAVQDKASKAYKWDDGSSEDAVGFGNGTSNVPAIWFNQFVTVKGGEAIQSVQIAYGTAGNSTPAASLNGEKVTIGIWSDPNNDGDPTDAKLIASVKGKISKANTDKFVTYTFASPVTIGKAGTSFFVGEVTPAVTGGTEYYFQAEDTTASAGHSWVAAQANGGKLNIKKIGKNDTVGTIDSFGLPGNWLIRATGVSSK